MPSLSACATQTGKKNQKKKSGRTGRTGSAPQRRSMVSATGRERGSLDHFQYPTLFFRWIADGQYHCVFARKLEGRLVSIFAISWLQSTHHPSPSRSRHHHHDHISNQHQTFFSTVASSCRRYTACHCPPDIWSPDHSLSFTLSTCLTTT